VKSCTCRDVHAEGRQEMQHPPACVAGSPGPVTAHCAAGLPADDPHPAAKFSGQRDHRPRGEGYLRVFMNPGRWPGLAGRGFVEHSPFCRDRAAVIWQYRCVAGAMSSAWPGGGREGRSVRAWGVRCSGLCDRTLSCGSRRHARRVPGGAATLPDVPGAAPMVLPVQRSTFSVKLAPARQIGNRLLMVGLLMLALPLVNVG
jgi:hypothetical protein